MEDRRYIITTTTHETIELPTSNVNVITSVDVDIISKSQAIDMVHGLYKYIDKGYESAVFKLDELDKYGSVSCTPYPYHDSYTTVQLSRII